MRFWKNASPPPCASRERCPGARPWPALERRRPPLERAHDPLADGEVVVHDVELVTAASAPSPGRSLGRRSTRAGRGSADDGGCGGCHAWSSTPRRCRTKRVTVRMCTANTRHLWEEPCFAAVAARRRWSMLFAGALAHRRGGTADPSNCAIVPDTLTDGERREAQHVDRADHGLQHVRDDRPVQGRRRADPAGHDAVHPGHELRAASPAGQPLRACSRSRSRSVTRPGRRTPSPSRSRPTAAARDHEPERHAVAGNGWGVLLLREPVPRRRGAGLHLVARRRWFAARAGALGEPGRITGTPTTAGTFVHRRVTDSRDAFAERTFSITIS